jgi:hypothetical protein
VVAVHPLVTEILAHLVDFVEAAYDQPLEVEFVGNAQVERHVEGVVVGLERARGGAAVQWLQHRCFDLQKAAAVQKAAQLTKGQCAEPEHIAHFGIDGQVYVAAAIPLLLVRQPMPLFRQGFQRLGQYFEGQDGNGHLAGLGAKERAGHAYDVAQVEPRHALVNGFAQLVDLEIDLDFAGGVLNVGKRALAEAAQRHDPTGHADDRLRLGERIELRQYIGSCVADIEGIGIGIEACFAPPGQLLEPMLDEFPGFCLHTILQCRASNSSSLDPSRRFGQDQVAGLNPHKRE